MYVKEGYLTNGLNLMLVIHYIVKHYTLMFLADSVGTTLTPGIFLLMVIISNNLIPNFHVSLPPNAAPQFPLTSPFNQSLSQADSVSCAGLVKFK